MKFKMAPNSLFAVLLRSPWWISLAVAALVVVLAQAFLPAQYATVGAMGCLPFAGIGLYTLARQLRRPSARQAEAILAAVGAMGWDEFVRALEDGYRSEGYEVDRISGAADLALRRNGQTTLVAARRWKAARPGQDALAALHAAVQSQQASFGRYVTLGQLSDNAARFARSHGIELVQAPGLVELLRKMPLRPV